MDDEEDEEIWSYKSLRRKRRSLDPQEQNTKKGKAHQAKPHRKSSPKKSHSARRKTTQFSPIRKDKVSPKRAKHEGFCPMCQMPLCLLIVESPSSHVTECMDQSERPEEECPAGVSCNNTIPSHYGQYRHSCLANHRAGNEGRGSDRPAGGCTTLDICSPDGRGSTLLSTGKSPSRSRCDRSNSTLSSSCNKSINDSAKWTLKSASSASKLSSTTKQSSEVKRGSSRNSSQIKKSRSEGDLGFFAKFLNVNTFTPPKEKVFKRQLDYENSDRLSVPEVHIIEDENSNTKPNVTKDGDEKDDRLKDLFDDNDRDISDMLADTLGSDSDTDRTDNEDENVDDVDGRIENDDCDGKEEIFAKSKVEVVVTPAVDEDSCGSVDFKQHLSAGEDAGTSRTESNEVEDYRYGGDANLSKSEVVPSQAVVKSAAGRKAIREKKGGRGTTLHAEKQSREVTNKSRSLCSQIKSTNQISEVKVLFVSQSPSAKNDKRLVAGGPVPEAKMKTATAKQSSLLSFFQAKEGLRHGKKDTSVIKKAALKQEVPEKKPKVEPLSSVKPKPDAKNDSKASVTGSKSAAMKNGFESDQSNSSDGVVRKKPTRNCPFYKKIPGTPFTVDAFCYGSIPECMAYFLSHFHYDHYRGLAKSFKHPIYCSKITGNLVRSKLYVLPEYIHTIPLDTPTVMSGVEVTFMEANHCPGSVLILFKLKDGTNILHTGDFRAHRNMEEYSPLVDNKIHSLYLDTTYCDPAYAFAEQQEVIDVAVSLVRKAMSKNPKTLVVCGSYTIGKERVFTAIAKALDSKIAVTREKKRVLDCLEDPYLKEAVTLSWSEARVHILPMGSLNLKKLHEHLQDNPGFEGIIALSPTGWSHSNRVASLHNIKPKSSRNGVIIYGIPYSEHSSFLELKRFVQFLKADRILPTVNNGNPTSRKKMETIFKDWMTELSTPGKRKSTPQQKTLTTFLRSSQQ